MQPGGQGGVDFAVDEGVRLAELVPPFAVAEDDPLAADVHEHRRADLAGEGAFLLGVAVLAAQLDRAAAQGIGDDGQVRRRRTDGDADALLGAEALRPPPSPAPCAVAAVVYIFQLPATNF